MNDFSFDRFNAAEVEPAGSFLPIPQGDYPAVITEAQWRDTKSGSGRYLQLKLEVQGGEHAGRVLFDRLNLKNPNATAVEIAMRTLSAICRAVGVMKPRDESELLYKPLVVQVVVRPDDGQHGPSNEIKGYKAAGSATATRQPAHGAGAAPWERGAHL